MHQWFLAGAAQEVNRGVLGCIAGVSRESTESSLVEDRPCVVERIGDVSYLFARLHVVALVRG